MTVTSSGIPITVSRMMIKYKSENKSDRVHGVISAGILLSFLLCVPLTLLVFSKSGFINLLFSDPRCLPILKIMIPGLIFTSVYAVIRGTFWGNKQFLPYSLIEFFEELVMLIAGIILVNFATDQIDGVKKAGLAVLISYLFSFTVSITVFFIKGGKLKSPKREFTPLFSSSAPITAMRTATSLINTLIAVLLPARLVYYGISSSDAVSQFGTVFGMAFPLIFMPSTIIGSLALVLVPELSSDYYTKNFTHLKTNIEKALKFSCFIACIIIPVFIALGEQIGNFLYSSQEAGIYIKKGALIMLPMSLCMISTSMLNSLNKEKKTLASYFVGASIMILCILFLPAIIGVDALTVGMFLNFLLGAIINIFILYKTSPKKPKFVKFLLISSFLILPSTIFGQFVKNILLLKTNLAITTILGTCFTASFSLLSFYIFGLLDFWDLNKKSNIKILKKRNSFNNRYDDKNDCVINNTN